jgi:large subunit ribosomal protein L23
MADPLRTKDPRDIILRPIVSEKSYALLDENKYTFLVDPRANKTQIKQAIEEIFDVKVTKVNTQNRRGKVKRRGWIVGKRSDTKRAIVQLAPGDEIELFETGTGL